jgi:hypothetical protein
MPISVRTVRRRLSLLVCVAAAACVAGFDPDNDDHVVGGETYATPFVVDGKGPVRVEMNRGQMGEHAGGVWRAWRVVTGRNEPLTPWLTTTPLVDGRDHPLLHVTTTGTVFAFDPGSAIDSRDEQTHLAKGWYRVGSRGVTGEPFDHVVVLPNGGYETVRASGDTQSIRVHGADGALAGEVTVKNGGARSLGDDRWRVLTRTDGAIVVVDDTLREQGRVVEHATAPGQWVDVSAVAPQAWPQPTLYGLGPDRELRSRNGEPLPGPWQSIRPLAEERLAVLLLFQSDNGMTLVEPTVHGPRVLMRDATFALAQTRVVPPEYAGIGWGEQAAVLLAGQKTAAGDGYVLFARIDGLLRGPFAAPTSEAATAAMWSQLAPVATARRETNERNRAAAAAAVAAKAAVLQGAIDQNQAKLDAVDREQIAYFDSLRTRDFPAAGRAIAAMEKHLEDFFVPQGHARTEALRQQYESANIYFLDWELRRPDRTLERLGGRAASYFFAGGALYERFCREAGSMLMNAALLPTHELLENLRIHAHGFSPDAKYMLGWHRDALDRREAVERYRALLAAGRAQDAHSMAYQMGFEGWATHLLTRAKGVISDGELEALLRAAVDRAPPELRAKLEAAHHAQWLDMIAAQEREQRVRFARMEEESRLAAIQAAERERERWATYKNEAARRGFIWRGNY